MKKVLLLLTIIAVLTVFASPVFVSDRDKDELTIGVVIPYEIGWFTAFHEGFELVGGQGGGLGDLTGVGIASYGKHLHRTNGQVPNHENSHPDHHLNQGEPFLIYPLITSFLPEVWHVRTLRRACSVQRLVVRVPSSGP